MFIVFEGGEGSGKSTQSGLLAERLRRAGREPVITREPGGTPRAEALRRLLLTGPGETPISDRTEALLFAAARADHVTGLIRPALERGAVVLCDRYIDSSIAYQGIARGLGADRIGKLNGWATAGLLPDLTLVLDVDPMLGLTRALDPNRLESEPLDFHRAVRDSYLHCAAAAPDRYRVIDAAQPAHAVAEQVWDEVARRLAVPA